MSKTVVTDGTTVDPKHYLWTFPGCPVKVHLTLDVVRKLQQRLEQGGDATREEGVLLGSADEGKTEITGYKPLVNTAGRDRRDGIASLVNSAGKKQVVGYYRFDRQEVLRLNESDLSLAETFFPEPHHVFLLVQPANPGPANAAFFFSEDGRMNGDFCFLEFPFDASTLLEVERQRIEIAERKQQEKALAQAALPAAPQRRSILRTSLALAGVVLAAAAGVTAVRFWPRWQSLLRPAASSATVSTAPRPNVGLHAERRNGDVVLTWTRDSAVVQQATSGSLSIHDGPAVRKIDLDAAQVRSGSILYSPVADQVQMDLTVVGQDGPMTESVLVILPQAGPVKTVPLSPPPAAAASAAKPAPLAKPLKSFTAPAEVQENPPASAAVVDPAPPVDAKTASSIDLPPVIGGQTPAPPPSVTAPPTANPPATQPNRPATQQAAAPQQAAPAKPESAPPSTATGSAPTVRLAAEIHRVIPPFPTALRGFVTKPVTVQVRVNIDEHGKVVDANAVPQKNSMTQLLVDAAVHAARQWQFQPAQVDGRTVASEMVLQFNFTPPW